MDIDHACLFYENQAEKLAALASFHRRSLDAGRRTIHVANDVEAGTAFRQALRDAGIDPDHETDDGSLLILTTTDVFRSEGRFQPEQAIAFWRGALDETLAAGYPGLAASADVSWALHDPRDLDPLVAYEARLEKAFEGGAMHFLCCYHGRSLPEENLARIVSAHCRVLLGDLALDVNSLEGPTPDRTAPAKPWLGPLLRRLRKAEEERKAMLALRQQLFEVTPAGVYTCDADGLITSFNAAAEEIWGRTPRLGEPEERFCGSHRLFLPDGTSLPHEETPMARALAQGIGFRNQKVVVERPDGSRVDVLVNIAPMHDAAGGFNGAINCFVDVSDRRRSEEVRGRLAAVVESADDAIISKDLRGTIKSWNRGAERLFGYTEREALGRSITMLIPPDREDEEPRILKRIGRGEKVETYETVRQRKDGSLLDVSLTVSPVVDGSGRVIGASKICRDITERKRTEAALREADRQKDEFLAMLAHELRNPLAPVRSAVEVLQGEEATDPERIQARTVLERQVENLARLVDDLLDVSRVTTGRIRLEREPLDLNDLVISTVRSRRSMFDERDQEVTVTIDGRPIWTTGDALRLEQVLVNLLSNASRYSPEGSRVEVITTREGERVVVRVKDEGPGIDPELQSRLFDLFAQGERPLDRRQGGLGVGLALTKRLVEMHDGAVSVTSNGPGGGSVFTVRLPAVQAPGEETRRRPTTDERHASGEDVVEARSEEPLHASDQEPLHTSDEDVLQTSDQEEVGAPGDEEPDSGASTEHGPKAEDGLRVLYVEDLADAGELAEMVLKMMGHDVVTALDGPSALEIAEQFHPDVVILDIGLPGMDGYEVARRIRGDPDLRDVVLIAITGYSQESDRRRSKEAGFDHHLVKPVDYLGTVQEILADVVPPVRQRGG